MLSITLLSIGHGTMRTPAPRSAGPGDSMWFSQGCSIGCDCDEENGALRMFTPVDLCKSGAKPTLPEEYRTFADIMKNVPKFSDFTTYRPWRSPGTATPLDSCGLAGGSTKNNDVAGGFGKTTIAHKQGFNGSALAPVAAPAKWTAGEVVEVSWEIAANHGTRIGTSAAHSPSFHNPLSPHPSPSVLRAQAAGTSIASARRRRI